MYYTSLIAVMQYGKDYFLRALREVATEMELFIVIKLIYIQSCKFRHLTKKLYLEEYV